MVSNALLREDLKCTFCTFVSDANEFKNDAYTIILSTRGKSYLYLVYIENTLGRPISRPNMLLQMYGVVLFG